MLSHWFLGFVSYLSFHVFYFAILGHGSWLSCVSVLLLLWSCHVLPLSMCYVLCIPLLVSFIHGHAASSFVWYLFMFLDFNKLHLGSLRSHPVDICYSCILCNYLHKEKNLVNLKEIYSNQLRTFTNSCN